ncbi:hypothetical protein D3C73_1282910 [compost metagenome]
MRKGPLLAAEVADIRNLQSDLLHDLPLDAVFQRLAGLDEASDQSVHIILEVSGVGEQNLIALQHGGYNGRCDTRIADEPAFRALP